jgi:hypothetical protein
VKFYLPLLNYPSGKPLLAPIEAEAFTDLLMRGFARDFSGMKELVVTTSRGAAFRGEIERAIDDRGDPVRAGWTYVIHADDPQRHDLIDAMEPLARERGMAKPREPLLFDGRAAAEWNDWLEEEYATLAGKSRPYYFLLVGSPEWLPFELQSYLDVTAAVGRIEFDEVADYESYVKKACRRAAPQVDLSARKAVFFATDGGPSDPTYYSREYLAKPLAMHARDRLGVDTQTLFGSDASRRNLTAALRNENAAVVCTASHGFGAFGSEDSVQRAINGAIQCEAEGAVNSADDILFGARDVSRDEPCLENGVLFQFACFGYGTPAESNFAHWFLEVLSQHGARDFVAALPKRLAAHPRGPIAFIGHLDLAFLQGFTDADAPDLVEPWHARIDPFADALGKLLAGQPVGLALEYMNTRAANLSSVIVNRYDRMKRGKTKDTPEFRMNLASTFVQLNDARNYMLFGDPAARLRIAGDLTEPSRGGAPSCRQIHFRG